MALCPADATSAKPWKVVAYGDSLTAGYQLPQADGFAPKLQAALRAQGHDLTVMNAGVSGDTSTGGLARLDWTMGDGADAVEAAALEARGAAAAGAVPGGVAGVWPGAGLACATATWSLSGTAARSMPFGAGAARRPGWSHCSTTARSDSELACRVCRQGRAYARPRLTRASSWSLSQRAWCRSSCRRGVRSSARGRRCWSSGAA